MIQIVSSAFDPWPLLPWREQRMIIDDHSVITTWTKTISKQKRQRPYQVMSRDKKYRPENLLPSTTVSDDKDPAIQTSPSGSALFHKDR